MRSPSCPQCKGTGVRRVEDPEHPDDGSLAWTWEVDCECEDRCWACGKELEDEDWKPCPHCGEKQ
jgi:hypothetical protein